MTRSRAAQRLEQGISADRLVAAPDQPQHVAPQLGQPRAALLAELRGAVERAVDAAVVVVARGLERAPTLRPGATAIRLSEIGCWSVCRRHLSVVMPGLVPGIHAFFCRAGRRGWPGLVLRAARP